MPKEKFYYPKLKDKKRHHFTQKAVTLGTAKKYLRKWVGANNEKSFDEAVLSQIEEGKFPEWTKALIEWEANPCNTQTVREFCDVNKCHPYQIDRIRRKYPGYWTAVKYKQKQFLAELGNLAMKTLARRMLNSDRALELALIITGEYTPTMKHTIEPLSPEEKKVRIEQMLTELKRVNEAESKIIDTTVVTNGPNESGHKSE